MSVSSVAGSLSAASAAQTRSQLSAEFVKQNADQASAIAAVVEQGAANAKAAAPAGLGHSVDVTV
ncbi:hypothetical protein H2509_17600 [Stappia sp. F7233]|uniref:Motility protein n=1 Tax=Stappia albiluteola TaxID=2758565 RepID=A0A839AIR0_9HYPH|nr:hypothetical protein [Stappia albiluteola]MBA5778946.1 hypothetical protein [Stappia albiluteola]